MGLFCKYNKNINIYALERSYEGLGKSTVCLLLNTVLSKLSIINVLYIFYADNKSYLIHSQIFTRAEQLDNRFARQCLHLPLFVYISLKCLFSNFK